MATKTTPPPKGNELVTEQSDDGTITTIDDKLPRIAVFSTNKALWTTFAL